MANFLLVADPDSDRRARFVRGVRTRLPPLDGLRTAECAAGDVQLLWAAADSAPISTAADGDGVAVLWGEAIAGPDARRIGAPEVARAWAETPSRIAAPWDGLYAAAVCRAHRPGVVVVGADLLGLFPIYFYGTPELLLVASSPELFRHHPAFRPELDTAGLVGLLLTAGIVQGRTLWRDVRRLAPGHLLFWEPRAEPQEVSQYALPASDRFFGLPFGAQVNLLYDAWDAAVARHALPGEADERCGLLLSGGRDSRLLAGALGCHGIRCAALTLGEPGDFEVTCATAVATSLGMEHTVRPDAVDRYPQYAELQVTWEHVANGLSSVYTWGVPRHLGALGHRVVAAYLVDPVVGGSSLAWAVDPATGRASFDTLFGSLNQYGIARDRLRRLLRREVFGDLVDETVERLRQAYDALPGEEFQKGWRFFLEHRGRFHAGGTPWRLCFGAWPVLPVQDHVVLETAGGMPAATLDRRRAEDEVLRRRFPDLARLPLDRNSSNLEPLIPSAWWRVRRGVRDRVAAVVRLAGRASARPGARRVERRRYVRLYDLNGPGWRAVRRQAEPYRERLAGLVVPEVLGELLPPPDVTVDLRDTIIDSTGAKLLLGLLIWSRDHM
ncbi:MAG: hypothetical protein DMD31_10675 [Gemmatimonadetes bacterium]|nr:MAG: hypothetical protein DMD31_10675 [Gemmatimonadota bacterium]